MCKISHCPSKSEKCYCRTVVGVVSLIFAERERSDYLSSERNPSIGDLLVEFGNRTSGNLASGEPNIFHSLFGTRRDLNVGKFDENNCDPVDIINN